MCTGLNLGDVDLLVRNLVVEGIASIIECCTGKKSKLRQSVLGK